MVFLGPPLGIVHHDIVLKRETDLQRQPDQQPQIRGPKKLPFCVGKQDYPEIVLASLQANGCDVVDILRRQRYPKLLKTPAGESRERLRQFWKVSERNKPPAAIGKVAQGFSRAPCVEVVCKFKKENPFH